MAAAALTEAVTAAAGTELAEMEVRAVSKEYRREAWLSQAELLVAH